ncbi:PREDICTED: uncharacterized protein LOC106743571, partial [Dinoponera quadriceps]|uniref:Uncharacterized protein LOC106743571 n=1 Tax=Dinoponera quadriceps TaxID=609295 RepID=A0A6P3X558_DINQU
MENSLYHNLPFLCTNAKFFITYILSEPKRSTVILVCAGLRSNSLPRSGRTLPQQPGLRSGLSTVTSGLIDQEDSDGALSAPELPSIRRDRGRIPSSPSVFTSDEYRAWLSRTPSTSALYEQIRATTSRPPRYTYSAENIHAAVNQMMLAKTTLYVNVVDQNLPQMRDRFYWNHGGILLLLGYLVNADSNYNRPCMTVRFFMKKSGGLLGQSLLSFLPCGSELRNLEIQLLLELDKRKLMKTGSSTPGRGAKNKDCTQYVERTRGNDEKNNSYRPNNNTEEIVMPEV